MKKQTVRLRLAPIVRDLNPTVFSEYRPSPRAWNDDDRRHLRARLGRPLLPPLRPVRDDAGYVLDTFPSVRREDAKQLGRYRTRDMILAYMNAPAAEDVETRVVV